MSKAFFRSSARSVRSRSAGVPSRPPEGGELTAYFRQLGDRLDATSGPAWEEFWGALQGALRRELHRRGLWESPPRFVGIEAAETWGGEALEELAVECYTFLMQRLRALHQHLKVKSNIDGLVILNIRHFLYERQKRCDPLGFRVFDIARAAVRRAADTGALHIAGGSSRIENATLLEPTGGEKRGEILVATSGCFQDRCQSWVDSLMPDFVLARGRQRRDIEEQLADFFGSLDGREYGAFPFKVLVDALKAAVRVRWNAVWAHEQDEATGSQREGPQPRLLSSALAFPQLSFEDEESFRALAGRVTEAVESAPGTVRQRDYLLKLWDFLRTSSADPGIVAIPSRRRTAARLGIPRYLLPELYGQLGRILESCREPRPLSLVKRRQGARRSR
ncbi:MAG: hypothetical protein K0U98_21095 [Deltaproteobacteria bacterium]|nr:hypothetical protein [Deltaproteobacteria bacterium]